MLEVLRHGRNYDAHSPVIAARFVCRKCGCEFLADAIDMESKNIYSGGEVVDSCITSRCPECGWENAPVQSVTLREALVLRNSEEAVQDG